MHSLSFLLHRVKRCLFVLLALQSQHCGKTCFRFQLAYLKSNEIKLHWRPKFCLYLQLLLIMKAMLFKWFNRRHSEYKTFQGDTSTFHDMI